MWCAKTSKNPDATLSQQPFGYKRGDSRPRSQDSSVQLFKIHPSCNHPETINDSLQLKHKMRKTLLPISTSLRTENKATTFNSGNFRRIMRNGFNRAMATTARFLEGLISDHTDSENEASKTRSLAQSNLLRNTVELPMNARSVAANKRANAKRETGKRRAEVLGMKNPHADVEDNKLRQYLETRGIRPLPHTNPCPLTVQESACPVVKRRNIRRLESVREKQMAFHLRNSNQVEDLDKYIRRRSMYLPTGKYSTFQRAPELVTNGGKVKKSNSPHKERRRKTPTSVRQGRTDWRKYEKERSMWPVVCRKRHREVTFESLMEEPENKIQKIAKYWLVRKPDADGENKTGQACDEVVRADWSQYELERSMWPQICVKRKRKVTLESLMEDPKQKVQRVGH